MTVEDTLIFFSSFPVARRCIPTFVDLESQVESVFNFSSPQDLVTLSNMTNAFGFDDLILNVSLQSILDGTL